MWMVHNVFFEVQKYYKSAVPPNNFNFFVLSFGNIVEFVYICTFQR